MNQTKNLIVPISGMHCRSCELLLEGEIKNVPGVRKVEVSHKRGSAIIEYDDVAPDSAAIEKAVTAAGYSVGVNKKLPLISTDPREYIRLLMAAGVLFVAYLILKSVGVLDIGIRFGSTPGYGIVALVGLVAGVSTCMALIGGIVLAVAAAHTKSHPEATREQKFRPHLFFNSGRIVGFAVFGGLIGLLGSTFRLSGSLLGGLVIIAGIVMIVLGIKLVGIFPRLESGGLTLPKGLARVFGIGKEVKEYNHRGAFLSGALTFFLPCGFTQAMQIYAVSAGSFVSGALIMGIFALGTAPGLLGIGGLTSVIKGDFARSFFKFAGLLVIVFGAWNISNGWNVTGLTGPIGSTLPNPVEPLPGLSEPGAVQEVRMTQKAFGYAPNRFTIKKDVPVRWVITSENQYTCAAYLNIPALGVFKPLQQGENIIEFTPTRTGPLKFTCSMGMYSGVFNVVK